MRWAKITVVAAALAAAGAGASAAVLAAGQDKPQQKQSSPPVERRERVVVAPDVQVLAGGGARIGVEVREVDPAVARDRKLPAVEGALVESVQDESPAAKAGVKAGDVIVGLDGERVRGVRQLQRLVGETPAGREVKLTVVRDGKRVDLSVAPEAAGGPLALRGFGPEIEADIRRGVEEGLRDLPRNFTFRGEGPNVFRFEGPSGTFRLEPRGEAPQGRVEPLPPPGTAPRGFRVEPGPNLRWFFDGTPATGRLGAVVQDLTPQLEEFFGVKEGVLVATVNPDSAGQRAGLKAGDVITHVNGQAVRAPAELVRELARPSDGAEITLGIVRDKKAQTLKVTLPSGARRGIRA